jgi:DNA-binding IclR family transcriptional regulator
MANWTFLTNHAHVLFCIADDADARIRDMAERVGITERAVQRIIAELEAEGYISRIREGRENRYEIHSDIALRHPIEAHRTIRDLMKMVRGR